MANMNVSDYAKYFIDNIGRATLANVLTISNKFASDYKFDEFVKCTQQYILELIKENKKDLNKCYMMLTAANIALTKYSASVNYSKIFIYNDFLIDIWKVSNGY